MNYPMTMAARSLCSRMNKKSRSSLLQQFYRQHFIAHSWTIAHTATHATKVENYYYYYYFHQDKGSRQRQDDSSSTRWQHIYLTHFATFLPECSASLCFSSSLFFVLFLQSFSINFHFIFMTLYGRCSSTICRYLPPEERNETLKNIRIV